MATAATVRRRGVEELVGGDRRRPVGEVVGGPGSGTPLDISPCRGCQFEDQAQALFVYPGALAQALGFRAPESATAQFGAGVTERVSSTTSTSRRNSNAAPAAEASASWSWWWP